MDKQQDNAGENGKRRAKSKPISLYPEQIAFVDGRANAVGSVSRYFQLLADYDKKHNVLPAALKELAEELERDSAPKKK